MSSFGGQDEVASLLQHARTRTRLVTEPSDAEQLTWTRETDARTALTRGLKEYLEQLSITDMNEGRPARFVLVEQTWAEPEIFAEYPSAAVYALEAGLYDARDFTPQTVALQGEHENRSVRLVSEFEQDIVVDCWSTDTAERMAVVAMLEDSLNPVDWMTGMRLELPHYHNVRATYEVLSMEYLDDQDSAQVRRRRAVVMVRGHIAQVRRVGVLPQLDAKFDLEVQDGASC